MTLIGELSLWVGLLMATWAGTVSFAGGALARRNLVASGARAIYAALLMVALASAGLWTAIFSHDFSIKYVASLTTANLPKAYLLASFWAGEAGSLLFSALVLAACGAIAVSTNRTHNHVLLPFVSGTLGLVLAGFLASACFAANPYDRLDFIPPEGRGLNPVLQNPGMLIQPTTLYLGYLATAIPFAFAAAALISRKLDAEWLAVVRRWSVIAWFFNAIGILLGMWWAYVESGRSGYWAWAPVENASLLPWLLNTALLLSLMLQEKRGVISRWNVELVIVTFLVAIFATFGTRGGLTADIGPFVQSRPGIWFGAFLLLAVIATAFLVAARLHDIKPAAEAQAVASNRLRYGGYLTSVSVVALTAGLIGLAFRKEYGLTLKPGDSHELTDTWGARWRFVSQGVSRYDALNREVTAIPLDVSRDGKPQGVITSERRQYVDSRGAPIFRPSTEAGIKGSSTGDVYVALEGVSDDETAGFRVTFNPLVRWIWIGGALLAIGGLLALWPQR